MKHQHVSQLLERRIRKGDYALTGMPAERDLAGEVGVSRVTIRRALEDLQCKGFIERLPNRRVVLSAKARTAIGNLQLAVVRRPTIRSPWIFNNGRPRLSPSRALGAHSAS